MRIPSFSIRNQRSIAYAECESVPRLMVIAGPNGAGKSTLLDALRRLPGDGKIIYIGPHRISRKQQVQARHLLQKPILLEELMAGLNMPSLEGIGLITGERDPWSFDDSVNYLKHGLCQIEIDRQQVITELYDRAGSIRKGRMPDVWQPLRELAANLLPHLRFVGIDSSNRDVVRCLWKVHKKSVTVDLDDLSSGEKSIIQMFYPLIEHRIRKLLTAVAVSGDESELRSKVCVLIDEPELHLHPNLQAKVLDYLRVLSSDEHTQVIVATHSPNFVEYANSDELYILRPVELVQPEENQLARVADDDERLRALRDIFGSTANLTAFQPVLIVEGGDREDIARRATDRKLYRALHSKFDRVTVIPGGGKSECLRLRGVVQQALAMFTEKLEVIALLDRDLAGGQPKDPKVRVLSVSMIENLLLDPDVIWEAIQSVSEKTGFKSADDVQRALDIVLDEQEEHEVQRRALSAIGSRFFRPHGSVHDIERQIEGFIQDLRQMCAPEVLIEREAAARAEVADIVAKKKRRELYHGKDVLDAFFKKHLHNTGLPREVFRFEAARYARRRASVMKFFDQLFVDILPEDLIA